jgi:uncharacterized membrane protein
MMSAPATRIRAIDWLRGLVMILMTIDHASAFYNAGSMHGDSAGMWVPGTPLPPGQFLTRWITHVCAPSFVLLAGASLALSTEKRRGAAGQTTFIVKRGLFIAALDPTWMTWALVGFRFEIFQVLYAIGLSLLCMAWLRRLSSRALLAIAVVIQAGGELTTHLPELPRPLAILLQLTFTGGMIGEINGFIAYPFVPWLAIMMLGWVLGRWLIATRERANRTRALPLFGLGLALLGLFIVIRGCDGYGNWGLYRESLELLQWLHVAKYPPSLAYTTLELGLAFMLLAGFFALDDDSPRRWLQPLGLFGATAFFFYLLHVHLLALAAWIFHIERAGLARAYLATAIVLLVLYPLCARYRRYKAAHPDGWTRYI